MKQTALQQAFQDIEQICPELFDIYTDKGKDFFWLFHKYLEMEKQQISHSWIASRWAKEINQTFEEYFNETYKTE